MLYDNKDYIKSRTLSDFVIQENGLSFETLLKSNYKNCYERWTPKSKKDFENVLLISSNEKWEKKIKDNIAYNLQYLEYIQKQLDELILREPIKNILNKNYLVTAISIIEGLFTYFLIKNNEYNYDEWIPYKKFKKENSKIEDINGIATKKEIVLFKKVEKFNKNMTLDSMIKKIKDKKLIDFGEDNIFEILNKNRELRNEIHIYSVNSFKSDYLTFTDNSQKIIKFILYKIITNKNFFWGDEREKNIIYDFLIDK